MTRSQKIIRWLTVAAIFIFVPGAFLLGLGRISVDADITSSIPKGDVVVDCAARILGRHPALDLLTIDLGVNCTEGEENGDVKGLVKSAVYVEQRLKNSKLFDQVGMDDAVGLMPELFQLVLAHLPQMFNSEQLEHQIAPRLTPVAIRQALRDQVRKLSGLQGLGQAKAMGQDPLGFRDLVLGRMAALNPAKGAHLYNGQLISSDGCHLLIVADPKEAGSDTVQARKISSLLNSIEQELPHRVDDGLKIKLSAIGAFRSALDNETIARADTKRALWIATLGVALLLFLCFPRPWLGLLALVPAVAGAAFALLVYSFLEPSISALALGFGGALITISVDHAIAYLQFLERAGTSTGRQASREVWSVGLIAAITTVGAFLALYLSGFSMLGQVGLFAALGVGFSFVFVHIVFPLLFPEVKSSGRSSILPMPAVLARIARGKSWVPVTIAALVMLAFALVGRPEFRVDLVSMNTVTHETMEAEKLVQKTWGDVFRRTYLLAEQATLDELRQRTDALVSILNEGMSSRLIKSGFCPSMVLPGAELTRHNVQSWRKFFTEDRVARTSELLRSIGAELGFSTDAFDPFIFSLASPSEHPAPVPGDLFALLGISHAEDGGWIWVGALEPGLEYDSGIIYSQASSHGLAVFDPALFSKQVAHLLGKSFTKMLLIVGSAVLLLLLVLFLDATMVAITIMPLVFSMICTMGLMKLLGHPLDIPSLMLGVVVLGMGVDYALYFVKAQQRYFRSDSPLMDPVRVAVFLAASSTLVGLGTLAMADHAVPHSAGFTTLLGIGFSLVGAFVILPPFLNRLFAPKPFWATEEKPGSRAHTRAVIKRYAHLEPSVRLFARFKLLFDPMFPSLAQMISPTQGIERILDIGCGYGLPSCYLAAIVPNAFFYAVEPDPQRVRITKRVLGQRAQVMRATAIDWDTSQAPFDLALFIDVVHHLDDEDLSTALSMISQKLSAGARLIIRADIPRSGRFAWERWMEFMRLRVRGLKPVFRSEQQIVDALEEAGFEIQHTQPCRSGREETWFVAKTRQEIET